ncbi:MAG: hypothetical protein ABFC38_06445 [Methanospirillum sp.]
MNHSREITARSRAFPAGAVRAGADGLRSREGERTENNGGPRPRPENHQRYEGREPAVPVCAGAHIACDRCADCNDAVRYRWYSRPVLLERRRLLGHALVRGGDAWLASPPAAEIASTVGARFGIDSDITLRRAAAEGTA